MSRRFKIEASWILAFSALLLIGGCSSYPTRFGLLPGGEVKREHAKPMEGGYYQDFDPDAESIEVTPVESTSPVMTQHVLVATVRDAQGNPLVGRRVEWIIPDGIGSIVEVDESGFMPTRGHKVDNKYAISHTNHFDHVLTRGNADPSDDIYIEKGQTWAVITAAAEGDTYLIAYAPAIYNWDRHKVNVIKHWVDAQATWPEDAQNPIGTEHEISVLLTRMSDGSPIAGVDVDFEVLEGPPASFVQGEGANATVSTDETGTATVTLVQDQPQAGRNVIGISMLRPRCGECASPVLMRHSIIKEWLAPQIAIAKSGPQQAAVGDTFTYEIAVRNPGDVAAQEVVVTDTLPEGFEYVSSQPEAQVEGQTLTWRRDALESGQTGTIQVTVRATREGEFENCAEVNTRIGLTASDCTPTVVRAAALQITKQGPDRVLICEPIEYVVTVRNTGGAPAENVVVIDQLPQGLRSRENQREIRAEIGTIPPGESREVRYQVMAEEPGTYENQAQASGPNGLEAQANHTVEVLEPRLTITKNAPAERFVGRPMTYEITVTNEGNGPAVDTILTDNLAPGVRVDQASQGGEQAGQQVRWRLGTIEPGASRSVTLQVTPTEIGDLENTATVEARCAQAQAQASTQVAGIPAILVEMVDLEDPIGVNQDETYVITVTNQGSAPGRNIRVVFIMEEDDQFVGGEGPTSPTSANGRIEFAPVENLPAKADATYRVVIRHTEPGDNRVNLEVTSDSFTRPITEEESTNVYQ